MATAALLTAALSMLARASACPGPTHATFDVVTLHSPVDVSENFTLAQLAELASRTGRMGRHPPLGFYIAGFGYRVVTPWCMNRPAAALPAGCAHQTMRAETGMPSRVIRLSTLHPIFASVR
jgi:hypothetical protein